MQTDSIRAKTGLSITALSHVLGVSRKTIVDWSNGGEPLPEVSQRLADLWWSINTLIDAGVEVSPPVLRRRVDEHLSILDTVHEGGDTAEVTSALVDTLTIEAEQGRRLETYLSGRRPTDLGEVDFGAPHYNETGEIYGPDPEVSGEL